MPPEPEEGEGGAVAHLAVLVAAHRGQIAGLDSRLTEVEDALKDVPGGKGLPAVKWAELSAEEAAAVRADLGVWVREVLFAVYPSAADSVRDCWEAHADAVSELSVLWLEWKRVYEPSRPPLTDALVLYDRWLPGTLKRVGVITARCGQLSGCVLTPQPRRY